MSYLLPHLRSGWAVDQVSGASVWLMARSHCFRFLAQAIVQEKEKLVVIRFGHDWDPDCMLQDETLFAVADKVSNFAVVYLVDITEVPDFNKMYELYDPTTVMFFFRNKHIMIDLGTGNNNKINWPLNNKQEMIDIIEVVYKAAKKGRGLAVSPKVSGCAVWCRPVLTWLVCRTTAPSTSTYQQAAVLLVFVC